MVQFRRQDQFKIKISHGHCVKRTPSHQARTMPHCSALQLGLLTLTLLLAGAEAKRSRSRSPYNDDFSDVITSDNSGLFIWRIEDFSPVPLSETKYGTFHNADSYIVLLSKLLDGRMHRGGQTCRKHCELAKSDD